MHRNLCRPRGRNFLKIDLSTHAPPRDHPLPPSDETNLEKYSKEQFTFRGKCELNKLYSLRRNEDTE